MGQRPRIRQGEKVGKGLAGKGIARAKPRRQECAWWARRLEKPALQF